MPGWIERLVGRALPGPGVRRIGPLGAGLDHRAVCVDGEWVLRVARSPGRPVTDEAALLRIIAEVSPVAVPEVTWCDPGAGAMLHRLLPGTPLLGRRVGDPPAVGRLLADLLNALAALPARRVAGVVPTDDPPPDAWRAEAAGHAEAVAAHLDASGRRAVGRFLDADPPEAAPHLCLCHCDLGAEHLLADEGGHRLTGVIDWTDAALADRARDVARVWRDLGDAVTAHLVRGLAPAWTAADAARARFHARCALLEDLAHGLQTGAAAYADNALANLDRVFR
ncbi:MAG: aminoglycoside phosphotransferase family protein [Thermoleophilia bacterium]